MKAFDYLVAHSLDAALAANDPAKVRLKAGGIDLIDLMKERLAPPGAPDVVLTIDRLDDLRGIRESDGGLLIGATTTLADVARSDLVKAKCRALWDVTAHAATPQVRERATVGGNLCQRPRCWYFRNAEFDCLKKGGPTCFAVEGESRYHAILGGGPCHIVHPSNLAPALVALDAQVLIRSARAGERRVAARDFFALPRDSMFREHTLDDGEIVTGVLLPTPPTQSAAIEFREKQSFDWPIAIAAVARHADGWRVALGAVAPVPWFSKPASDLLGNADVTLDLATRAGDAAASEARPMRDNAYKVQLVKVAVKRSLLAAAGLEVPK